MIDIKISYPISKTHPYSEFYQTSHVCINKELTQIVLFDGELESGIVIAPLIPGEKLDCTVTQDGRVILRTVESEHTNIRLADTITGGISSSGDLVLSVNENLANGDYIEIQEEGQEHG